MNTEQAILVILSIVLFALVLIRQNDRQNDRKEDFNCGTCNIDPYA